MMTDRDTPIATYDSLRSILRAIDESDDDLAPFSDKSEPESNAARTDSGNSVICKFERVTTAVSGASPSTAADFCGDRAQHRLPFVMMSEAGRAWIGSLARASALGLLLAGAVLVIPVPTGEWARAALDELQTPADGEANQVLIAEPAERRAAETSELPPLGLQAFAELAQKAFAAAAGVEVESMKSVLSPEIQEAASVAEAAPEVTLQPVADEGLIPVHPGH